MLRGGARMNKNPAGQIPILIGVTGHRDVVDVPALVQDFTTVIKDISRQYPASPLVLLTPLAEGADRAAARAVLDLKSAGVEADYITILPMEEGEYTGTFSGPQSIDEYFDLKGKGMGSFQVPLSKGLGAAPGHPQLYANLGVFLAQSTQVLIAAWNGAEEDGGPQCAGGESCFTPGAGCPRIPLKLGGTYHVLRVRFFGVDDDYKDNASYLSGREFGPVYWIKTKRLSSDYIAEGEGIMGPVYPPFPIVGGVYEAGSGCDYMVTACFSQLGGKDRTYVDILTKLNDYNLDVINLCGSLQEPIEASREDFFTPSPIGDESSLARSCNLVEHYAVSDCLSIRFQGRRRRDIMVLVGMAFLGLLSFGLYSGPLPAFGFILGYTGLYAAGIAYYLLRIKPARNHGKYVDYRGIAEALRVQYFWSLARVPAKVTDVYLIRQMSSVSWIKVAIDNILLLSKTGADGQTNVDPWELSRSLWLEKQKHYYDRKQPLKHKAEVAQKGLEIILFGLGLSIAFLVTGTETLKALSLGKVIPVSLWSSPAYSTIQQWVVFAVGFLPVIIASYKVFTELMAYSKLARNYGWMRMVYSVGLMEFNRICVKHCANPGVKDAKLGKLVYDIGVEALSENEEWVGILDDRVPELPK